MTIIKHTANLLISWIIFVSKYNLFICSISNKCLFVHFETHLNRGGCSTGKTPYFYSGDAQFET
jgi:hypothetical protein